MRRRQQEIAPGSGDVIVELPESSAVYRCMADIKARPIRWLWPGRIARGKVSMIAGHPGLGKSQVTASLAAIVTTGGRWPVDWTPCELGSVVIMSAEDDPADTIRPRLEAAGADARRIYILEAVREPSDGSTLDRPFNLKTDLCHLDELMEYIGDVSLVVIDPITAYLGGADSHKNAEVRALLAPLSELASRHCAAVVCVSHLNKGAGEAMMRVNGSLAFVAAARAAFLVAKDRNDKCRRLFLPVKNNIGNDVSGLAFRVEGHSVKGIETSRVSWEPEAVEISADEALVVEADTSMPARSEAKEWLNDLLADGPVAVKEIESEAKAAGLSWATVRRAKDALGIRSVKVRFDGQWSWSLPKMLEDVPSQKGEHLGEP